VGEFDRSEPKEFEGVSGEELGPELTFPGDLRTMVVLSMQVLLLVTSPSLIASFLDNEQ
jgi:hypothetical protein